MKRFLLPIILLALTACASVPQKPIVQQPAFHADMYEVVVLEYASPTQIVGVTPYGPTDKEELCNRAAAASVAQGDQMPGGHEYAATCLHIALSAPALNGQVVVQPFTGTPAAYIAIAAALDRVGNLIGVKPLRGFADATSCQNFGEAVRSGVLKDHALPAGTSFLIYCLGAPVLPTKDSTVMDKPCPNYPFVGAGPCQIATLLRVSDRR